MTYLKFLAFVQIIGVVVSCRKGLFIESDKKQEISVRVPLITFDGAEGTTFTLRELNDPVMVSNIIKMGGNSQITKKTSC